MEIIDAHAHIYPAKIAEKATVAIGDFYNIEMSMPDGKTERLIESGKKAGISRFLVHSCATKPHQVRAINEFILEEITAHPEFIGFMTLHQDLSEKEMEDEILWCKERGFKGIKLHPDFQRFPIDGEDAQKIYRALLSSGTGFPILFHTGDKRYNFSNPEQLAVVAKQYGDINFIGAHFGGYSCWDRVKVYKGLKNVYFDTSSSLAFITPEKAKELIEYHGADRFFFGTDFPMWDATEELERFNRIDLSEEEKSAILAGNIKKLLFGE